MNSAAVMRGTELNVEITADGIEIRGWLPRLTSLDVLFNCRRIWSFAIEPGADSFHPWPEKLAERLFGSCSIEVRDSGTQDLYGSARVRFDATPREFTLLDSAGRPLMVNKWMRLAPMLADGEGTDRRDELITLLAHVRDELESLAMQVFAVGGTALGPYRDGDLFAHDDDGDLAVLIESHEPVNVSRSIMRLESELRDRGYRVRAHSHAHLQVYAPHLDVDPKLYVDVFAAFFKDGLINQPFHVRAPFRHDQLTPFGCIEVRGEQFPVARDIESWFAANYDENWRVPQPGYRIETPMATRRRFLHWFGTYNLHRHFWEAWARDNADLVDYRRLVPEPKPVTFSSRLVLNVGSGLSPYPPNSVVIESPAAEIFALDYADQIREQLQQVYGDDPGLHVCDVNFGNYQAILRFVASLPEGPFDVYAGFSIESQDRVKRERSFWRLARMALRSGGTVIIDHLDVVAQNYSFSDPQSWHLDPAKLERECTMHGLKSELIDRGHVMVAGKRRTYLRTRIVLVDENRGTGPRDVQSEVEGKK